MSIRYSPIKNLRLKCNSPICFHYNSLFSLGGNKSLQCSWPKVLHLISVCNSHPLYFSLASYHQNSLHHLGLFFFSFLYLLFSMKLLFIYFLFWFMCLFWWSTSSVAFGRRCMRNKALFLNSWIVVLPFFYLPI